MAHPPRLNMLVDEAPAMNRPAFGPMSLRWIATFGPVMYPVSRPFGGPVTARAALRWSVFMGLWLPPFAMPAQGKKAQQSAR